MDAAAGKSSRAAANGASPCPHGHRWRRSCSTRCWRGPAWINTAWLLVPSMRSLGYAADADRIVSSLVHAVDRCGYREYYNPLTGRGLAARGFGFSTLLIDLLAVSGFGPGESSAMPRMMQT